MTAIRRIVGLLVIAAACTASNESIACSCAGPETVALAVQQSTAVFVGQVTSIEPVSQGMWYTVTFAVDAAWKGIEEPVVVATVANSAACGYPFKAEERYLVFARAGSGELHVHLCSRTAPLGAPGYDGQPERDVENLGPPSKTWAVSE